MRSETSKDQALEAIDDERRYWQSIVDRVGDERLSGVTVFDDWDFRDLVAHLLAWRELGINALEIEAGGETSPGYPWPAELTEVDDINRWYQQQYAGKSVEDLLETYDQIFDRLTILVSALPEDDLQNSDRFTIMDGQALAPSIIDRSFFEHLHDEHGEDIEAFLNQDD